MNTTANPEVKCPKCKSPMVLRTARKTGNNFWGCSNFPKCKGIKSSRSGVTFSQDKEVIERKEPQFEGTRQQEAIWQEIISGSQNVMVKAYAGCGKSSTISKSMWQVSREFKQSNMIYLAFNSAIVQEFEEKSPHAAEIMTFNQCGHRICNNPRKIRFSKSKLNDIVQSLWKAESKKEIEAEFQIIASIKSLVNLCKNNLIDGTDPEELLELTVKYDLPIEADYVDLILDLVPKVINQSKNDTSKIDFTDQLYLPVVKNMSFPKYDFVFIDEAQDLNPLQHQFVKRLCHASTKVIVVGDPNQAIYGWRGADVDSMPNLAELLGNVIELPLTNSFRCAKSIAQLARQYVSDFGTLSDAEGTIEETTEPEINHGDMVLCYRNAPIIGYAFRLLADGKKVKIQGRDFGQSVVALIDSFHVPTVNELYIALHQWQTEEIKKYKGTKYEESQTEKINDKVQSIELLCSGLTTVFEVKSRIKELFTDNGDTKGVVLLTSIHRSKGLEADRVVWIDYDWHLDLKQDWQLTQQDNLRYVANTRAKNELVLVPRTKR